MEIGKPERKIKIVPVEEPVPSPVPMPDPAEEPVVEPVPEPAAIRGRATARGPISAS